MFLESQASIGYGIRLFVKKSAYNELTQYKHHQQQNTSILDRLINLYKVLESIRRQLKILNYVTHWP